MDFERTVTFCAFSTSALSLGTHRYDNINVSLCVACLEKEVKRKCPRLKTRIEYPVFTGTPWLTTLGDLHIRSTHPG